ncbi:hypothetical protein CR513_28313, partial [Mucuna pruriens]
MLPYVLHGYRTSVRTRIRATPLFAGIRHKGGSPNRSGNTLIKGYSRGQIGGSRMDPKPARPTQLDKRKEVGGLMSRTTL